jgi:sugar phosphate isomerase/epimerase
MRNFNRRSFIKSISATAIAGMILPKTMLARKTDRIIGLQLYTLRDLIKEDFESTLEIVADIGFKTIESAGYDNGKFYGFYPDEFKRIMDGFGLQLVSHHVNFSLREAPEVIDKSVESGASYLVIPWLAEEKRKSIDSYKRLAEEFNQIGELCKKSGLKLAYHNHAFEFEEFNGVLPYNVLLDNTEPELVCMELDIYWITRAGYNPQEYFQLYPGRFKLWHVKDMDETEEMNMMPVGKGIINFQSIFRQQKKAGLEFSFVEQDYHLNEQPILNIKESYRYLSDLPAYEQ